MKRFIFYAAILLFTTQMLYGENKDIKNIRKWFKEINQKSNPNEINYPMLVINDDQYSTEGGRITVFLSKKKFKKISAVYLGETNKYQVDFYFKDGKVFFIYQVRTIYNAPIYITKPEAEKQGIEAFNPEKSKVQATRYYYKDGKLIRFINEKNKKINVDDKSVKEKSKAVKEELKRILAIIKKEI